MSQKKIKQRLTRRDAVQAIKDLDNMAQLPELLKQALAVNETLVTENARLNEEVSNILEEHEQRLTTLENVFVKQLAYKGRDFIDVQPLLPGTDPKIPEGEPHEG